METERVVHLAEQQFGRVARRQLLGAGFSKGRIRQWLSDDRLLPLLPGVYALGHRVCGEEGELSSALLYAGPRSALARATALWWMGILKYRPNQIHIDAPGHRRSRDGIAIHHPRSLERALCRGLPTIPAATALVDSADSLSNNALRRALAQAEFHGHLKLEAVLSALGKGRAGSSRLRAALAAHMPQLARTENDFEADFLFLLERFGLPLPEVNVRVGSFRPDMLWREHRLIVELDGKDAHTNPAQVARDHDRDLKLRAMGFTVVRYTWAQVYFEAEAVASDLRRLLAG